MLENYDQSMYLTVFSKHERLGPMELLKAEAGELDGLAFVNYMKDGESQYTGYLNQ